MTQSASGATKVTAKRQRTGRYTRTAETSAGDGQSEGRYCSDSDQWDDRGVDTAWIGRSYASAALSVWRRC